MHAAILSIGDELTLGQNLDTNAQWLSEALGRHGVVVVEHRTVADDRDQIASAIDELAQEVQLLIVTGGLGPTDDDLTRFALGDVIDPGAELLEDPVARRRLDRWFRDRPMAPGNLRQTLHPPSATLVPNSRGTAPGLAATRGDCRVFLLPGPPRELRPMFQEEIVPTLPAEGDGEALVTLEVHEFGLGESDAARRLGDLTARDRRPLVGTTASRGIVTARIRDTGPRVATEAAVADVAAEVERLWHPYAFGRGAQGLAAAAGTALLERGETLATAESCTGGWLGKRIVDVDGASGWFRGGWVTYSNEMKTSCLGVAEPLLAEHGAVSAPVADAMARGARAGAGADWGLGITGIAGPDGGGPGKPVGTVFIGLAGAGGAGQVRRFRFPAERSAVRERSVHAALQMLRLSLLGAADEPLIWQADLAESSA